MKRYLMLLLLSGLFAGQGAEKSPPPRTDNRFLFLIETSSATSRSAKRIEQAVVGLVRNRINGQLRAGDTFGIWTYNSTLRAGNFPMQRWTPAAAPVIGMNVAKFMEQQKFENQATLDPVLTPLFNLIRSSRALTIILISEGKQSIQGIPFDEEIYRLYQQYYLALHESHIPFVTVLVVRNGEIKTYAVNSTILPIRIPNPPLEFPAGADAGSGTNTVPNLPPGARKTEK